MCQAFDLLDRRYSLGHLDFWLFSQPWNCRCRLKRVGDRQLAVCCVGSDAALRISGSVFVMCSLICIFGRLFFMPDMG